MSRPTEKDTLQDRILQANTLYEQYRRNQISAKAYFKQLQEIANTPLREGEKRQEGNK